MTAKRLFLAVSALAFAFTVSAATTGAEAKMMKKGMSKKGMMMKKKAM